jgi:lambda family phage portal protein
MGLLANIFGGRRANAGQRVVRARADAGETNRLNQNHWSKADGLSADAALSPAKRRLYRNRARYEASSNGYLSGMVHTLATDTIGTGPTLLLDCGPDANQDAVARVEDNVFEWHQRINLAEKLRMMRMARAIDGEQFGLAVTNRRLRGVQLDLRLVEAEMVADPLMRRDITAVDGIKYDRDGNPDAYHVLARHPGDLAMGVVDDGRWVPAQFVHHAYNFTRAGQHRGIGEVVPALELFAMLRRYQYAVVRCAETGANVTMVMETTMAAEAAAYPALEAVELYGGTGMALPEGWVGRQLKAEQPTSTFDAFERRILMQLSRCLNMPYIVAVMDATGANYSTMRGDYLVYRKHIGVDRAEFERVVLDPMLERWIEEASILDGLIPDGLPPRDQWTWRWRWDGFEHIDPRKEAEAESEGIRNRTMSRADICSKRGRDWRQTFRQIKAEEAYAEELGIDVNMDTPTSGGQIKEAAEAEAE